MSADGIGCVRGRQIVYLRVTSRLSYTTTEGGMEEL